MVIWVVTYFSLSRPFLHSECFCAYRLFENWPLIYCCIKSVACWNGAYSAHFTRSYPSCTFQPSIIFGQNCHTSKRQKGDEHTRWWSRFNCHIHTHHRASTQGVMNSHVPNRTDSVRRHSGGWERTDMWTNMWTDSVEKTAFVDSAWFNLLCGNSFLI